MKQEFILPTLTNSTIRINNGLYVEEERSVDWHFHEEIEFLWVREYEKDIYINNSLCKLQKDDIIFINERIPHKTHTPKGARTFMLQFNPTHIAKQFFSITHLPFYHKNSISFLIIRSNTQLNRILRDCLHEILVEHTEQKKSYAFFLKTMVCKLVAILYRYEILDDPTTLYSSKSIERLSPVLNYIEKYYASPITIAEMSNLINVERSYFCRLFKKTVNISFMEYLYSVRFAHAENLLLHSDKNITEIAYQVGFSSPAYFTKIFRERKGYSPTFYKNLQKR